MPNLTEPDSDIVYRALLTDATPVEREQARAILDIAGAREHNAQRRREAEGFDGSDDRTPALPDCDDLGCIIRHAQDCPEREESIEPGLAAVDLSGMAPSAVAARLDGYTERALALDGDTRCHVCGHATGHDPDCAGAHRRPAHVCIPGCGPGSHLATPFSE